MIYILLTPLFFIVLLIYFWVAEKFNIIDKPNERSSHTQLTIRGGGVIFLVAIWLAGVLHPGYWMIISGATIIGAISFIDDRITLSRRIRMLFHLIALIFLLWSLNLFSGLAWYLIPLIYILVIGIINAYNFMDGINGITGLYSLVVLGGLQYVNLYEFSFIEQDMIWMPMLSCLVFLFFNFRKRAKCFAGDVGSVTMAFWIVFLMLKLIKQTDNYVYILFLAVYGVDSVLTILHRLYLKQNIFEAHRLHFYQILANDQQVPHLIVSSLYGLLQLILIVIVIYMQQNFWIACLICVVPLTLVYIAMKPKLMLIHKIKINS